MSEYIINLKNILKFDEEKNWKHFIALFYLFVQKNSGLENISSEDIINKFSKYFDGVKTDYNNLDIDDIDYANKKFTTEVIENIKKIDVLDLVYTDEKGEYNYTKEYINLSLIVDKWINKAKNESYNSINLIEADKYLAFDKDFIKENNEMQFNLYVSDSFFYEVFKIKYKDRDNVDIFSIKNSNGGRTTIYDDKIVINTGGLTCAAPDIGRRFALNPKDNKVNEKRKEVYGLNNILKSIPENSVLTTILPTGFLVSPDAEGLRSLIIPEKNETDNDAYDVKVNKIYQLPRIKRYSSISLVLIEFKDEKFTEHYDINIGRFIEKDEKLTLETKTEINSEKFAGGNRWSLKRYLEKEKFWDYFESSEKIALEKKSFIIRGKAITKKFRAEDGEFIVVNLRNIKSGKLVLDGTDISRANQLKPKSFSKYTVKPKDVLVACRGTLFKSAYIPELDNKREVKVYLNEKDREMLKNNKLVASVNTLIVTMDEDSKILPKYLNLLINLDVGKKLLENIQRGNIVKNLNPSDLNKLKIPYHSIEEQKRIVDSYEQAVIDYKNAKKNWGNTINSLNNTIIGKK